MDTIQPSEKAMQNLYKFLGRVLPKYLTNEEINRSNDRGGRVKTSSETTRKGA